MNREGRQSHVVHCPAAAATTATATSRLRRYGIHHRRRGDRVRPCCLRWYAWGRVVHPRRGLHCDGRGCCVRGGFPDGHWPVEAVHRRSERNCRGVATAACRCRLSVAATCTTTLASTAPPAFGPGCVGRCHFQTVHRRHCLGEGCVRLWPWAALLVRMRSIISERAALAAACITSRLGGLPAPPQMVWRPMAMGSAFRLAQGQSLQ